MTIEITVKIYDKEGEWQATQAFINESESETGDTPHLPIPGR